MITFAVAESLLWAEASSMDMFISLNCTEGILLFMYMHLVHVGIRCNLMPAKLIYKSHSTFFHLENEA